MTVHTVCYESLSNQSAGSNARPPHGLTASHVTVPISGVGQYAMPRPEVPPSGYGAVPVSQASLLEFGDTDIFTEAWSSSISCAQAGLVVDNTSSLLVKETTAVSGFNSGRMSPRVAVDFNGAAEPANPVSIEAHVQYAHSSENYQGVQHFCEFEDHPPDSNAAGPARLAQLMLLLQTSSNTYLLGNNAAGTPIVADRCGFAGVAPEGAVYIRPEDVGNGPDQIPGSTDDNTAAAFRAHPSVFYPSGRTRYARALTRQAVDTVDIADGSTSGGPLQITTIDSSITSSRWLVSVDGQPMIVNLSHPGGSDFRRPRDIWNNVWVPIITGPGTLFASVQFAGGVGNLGGIGFRWKYADYFRCLPLAGSNVIQTGVG